MHFGQVDHTSSVLTNGKVLVRDENDTMACNNSEKRF